MSVIVTVRVFADLCFYFAVGSFFGKLFPLGNAGLLTAPMCAFGAGIFTWLHWKKPLLSHLALLLPPLSLFWAGSWTGLLFLLPPLIYTESLLLRNCQTMEYWTYREMFGRLEILWAALLITAMLYEILHVNYDVRTESRIPGMLFYGGLHTLSGIFLLRQLRLKGSGGNRSLTVNLLELSAVAGTAGGAASLLWMGRGLFTILQSALYKLIGGFLTLILTPLWLLIPKGPLDMQKPGDYETSAEALTGEVMTAPEVLGVPTEEFIRKEPASASRSGYLSWMAAAVILIVILLLMYRIQKKGGGGETPEEGETGHLAHRPAMRPEKRLFGASNREKVRQSYREFLKLLRKKGVKLKSCQTSQEILHQARSHLNLDSSQTEALRRLYLAARYDEKKEVDSRQVKEAKELLKELKRKNEPG